MSKLAGAAAKRKTQNAKRKTQNAKTPKAKSQIANQPIGNPAIQQSAISNQQSSAPAP
jgi:hypothetical protein